MPRNIEPSAPSQAGEARYLRSVRRQVGAAAFDAAVGAQTSAYSAPDFRTATTGHMTPEGRLLAAIFGERGDAPAPKARVVPQWQIDADARLAAVLAEQDAKAAAEQAHHARELAVIVAVNSALAQLKLDGLDVSQVNGLAWSDRKGCVVGEYDKVSSAAALACYSVVIVESCEADHDRVCDILAETLGLLE